MRSVKPDGRLLRFGADKIRLPAAAPGLLCLPNEEARKPWGTKTDARQGIALCNAEISAAHRRGKSVPSLAARCRLAPSTLRAILRKNR